MDGSKDEVIRNINHFYATDSHTMDGDPILNFNLPQYYQVISNQNENDRIEPYRSDSI